MAEIGIRVSFEHFKSSLSLFSGSNIDDFLLINLALSGVRGWIFPDTCHVSPVTCDGVAAVSEERLTASRVPHVWPAPQPPRATHLRLPRGGQYTCHMSITTRVTCQSTHVSHVHVSYFMGYMLVNTRVIC